MAGTLQPAMMRKLIPGCYGVEKGKGTWSSPRSRVGARREGAGLHIAFWVRALSLSLLVQRCPGGLLPEDRRCAVLLPLTASVFRGFPLEGEAGMPGLVSLMFGYS